MYITLLDEGRQFMGSLDLRVKEIKFQFEGYTEQYERVGKGAQDEPPRRSKPG